MQIKVVFVIMGKDNTRIVEEDSQSVDISRNGVFVDIIWRVMGPNGLLANCSCVE